MVQNYGARERQIYFNFNIKKKKKMLELAGFWTYVLNKVQWSFKAKAVNVLILCTVITLSMKKTVDNNM